MDDLSFVKHLKNLPTPSPVQHTIRRVVENAESTPSQVVEVLKLDPVTAGRVLHLANSASIGLAGKISCLENAVVLLGLPRIHSLILVSPQRVPSALDAGPDAFPLERYWRHSTTVALIAESIARHCQRYGAIDEQEAYSAGLLHDIGKCALSISEGARLMRVRERILDTGTPFYRAEEPEWSHTAAGTVLARAWNFPEEISLAISEHHTPGSPTAHSRLIAVVHVADVMVHMIGFPVFPDEPVPPIDEKALEMVMLPPERLRIIAETGMENQKKLEEVCGMNNSGY